MLVIFDCDGVLVDSELLSARVLTESLLEAGFDIGSGNILESYRGKSAVDCMAKFIRDFGGQAFLRSLTESEKLARVSEFWQQMQAKTIAICEERLEPIEGVEAVLKSLSQQAISFCVASNGKHAKMQITLTKTGLMHYVQGRIFSVEDVKQGKPAPDLFLLAARTLNATPNTCVVVEDSLTGIQAALAAGMHPIAYCPPAHDGADNYLLKDVQALGVEVFFAMNDLVPLLIKQGKNL